MKTLYVNLVVLLAYSPRRKRPVSWVFYSRLLLIGAVIYYFVGRH